MNNLDLIRYGFLIVTFVFMLRLWMQYIRVDYYNSFTQNIIKITQPIIGPLRKLIPSIGKIDTATLLIVILLSGLKIYFIVGWIGNIYFLVVFLTVIATFGKLIFWILIIRAIMSWVSPGYNSFSIVLAQLTEPLITPIRKIIPPLGMIDISFMIFIFGLYFLNSLAFNWFGNVWAIAML